MSPEEGFVDIRDTKKKEETESKVKDFEHVLKNDIRYFNQTVLGVQILILSCEKELRIKIRDTLRNEGYSAFVIDDKKEDFSNLPEFELEKRAMDFVNVIIVVDSKNVKEALRCPGLVSECTYIMMNKRLQDKTILIVPNNLSHKDITKTNDKHYLYFPAIYFVDYENITELIDVVCSFAKKEVHRMSYAISNSDPNRDLKDLYGENHL